MRAVPRPLTEPWLISAAGRELVFGVWSRGELYQEQVSKAWAAATNNGSEPLKYSRATTIENGIAVIQIEGPLFRKAGLFSEISGATSYEQIRKDLRLALADAQVRGILFNVNSPGGEANGCSELADEIFAARGRKLIWAYIGGAGQSAACWLFTAAEYAVCSDTALLGCIGVRQSIVDTSKSDESRGVKIHDLVNDESPEKRDYPVDEQVLAKQMRQINALFEVFKSAVARNRGVSEEEVVKKFGAGDSLVGAQAVAAGLADEIGSLETAIAGLRAKLDAADQKQMKGPYSAADGLAREITQAVASGLKNLKIENKEKPMSVQNEGARADEPKKDEDEKEKKESKAEGGEMKKCADCDGEGEKDGEKCETCDGDGEVPMGSKASEDEDEKESKAEEEPEGEDDGDAKKALAKMAGISANSSLSKIAATLEARTTSLADVAKLKKKNAEMSARLDQLEAKDIAAAADSFVSAAIKDGRTVEEKRAHLIAEFSKAERAKAGSGPAAIEPSLFEKHTFTAGKVYTDGKGKPIGKKEEHLSLAQDDPVVVREKFAARAQEISKSEKIGFGEACRRVKAVDPELYATYAALPPR